VLGVDTGRATIQLGGDVGQPIDVLDGFVRANGDANGRPVGVVIDKQGALLVADDVGNTIWRVTRSAAAIGRVTERTQK